MKRFNNISEKLFADIDDQMEVEERNITKKQLRELLMIPLDELSIDDDNGIIINNNKYIIINKINYKRIDNFLKKKYYFKYINLLYLDLYGMSKMPKFMYNEDFIVNKLKLSCSQFEISKTLNIHIKSCIDISQGAPNNIIPKMNILSNNKIIIEITLYDITKDYVCQTLDNISIENKYIEDIKLSGTKPIKIDESPEKTILNNCKWLKDIKWITEYLNIYIDKQYYEFKIISKNPFKISIE